MMIPTQFQNYPSEVQRAYQYLTKFINKKDIFHISELFAKGTLLTNISDDLWNDTMTHHLNDGKSFAIANHFTTEYYTIKSHKELWDNYLPNSTQQKLILEMAEYLGFCELEEGHLYCLDVGVLLENNDANFDGYNDVYDKEYGYYDENQISYREKDLDDAKAYARKYVEEGVDMTYAIITNQGTMEYELPFDNGLVEGFTYNVEDIIFSIAKIHGNIVENFVYPSVQTITR